MVEDSFWNAFTVLYWLLQSIPIYQKGEQQVLSIGVIDTLPADVGITCFLHLDFLVNSFLSPSINVVRIFFSHFNFMGSTSLLESLSIVKFFEIGWNVSSDDCDFFFISFDLISKIFLQYLLATTLKVLDFFFLK